MDHAKQLTFDKNVSCRTVTINGEDFKPSGVLTGGSRSTRSAMLLEMNAISANSDRIIEIQQRIKEIDGKIFLNYDVRYETNV